MEQYRAHDGGRDEDESSSDCGGTEPVDEGVTGKVSEVSRGFSRKLLGNTDGCAEARTDDLSGIRREVVGYSVEDS